MRSKCKSGWMSRGSKTIKDNCGNSNTTKEDHYNSPLMNLNLKNREKKNIYFRAVRQSF